MYFSVGTPLGQEVTVMTTGTAAWGPESTETIRIARTETAITIGWQRDHDSVRGSDGTLVAMTRTMTVSLGERFAFWKLTSRFKASGNVKEFSIQRTSPRAPWVALPASTIHLESWNASRIPKPKTNGNPPKRPLKPRYVNFYSSIIHKWCNCKYSLSKQISIVCN